MKMNETTFEKSGVLYNAGELHHEGQLTCNRINNKLTWQNKQK